MISNAKIEAALRRPTLNKEDKLLLNDLVGNLVTSRQELMRQFLDPRRDINAECGYPETAELNPELYRDLYDRESIATRTVQVLPMESWQSQPSVYEDDDVENVTPFEKAWDDLPKKLRGDSWYKDEEGSPIWEHLRRADILSGIGHFGIVLIGIDDGKQLSEPIDGFEDAFGPLGPGTDAQYGNPLAWQPVYQSPGYSLPGKPTFARNERGWLVKVHNAIKDAKEKELKDGEADAEDNGKRVPVQERDTATEVSGGPDRPVPPHSGMEDDADKAMGRDDTKKDKFGKDPNKPQFGQADHKVGDVSDAAEVKTKYNLLFLRSFDETLVQITRYETDERSPRFGQPTMYLVTFNDPREHHTGIGVITVTRNVHWSRIIHIADNLGSSEVFGVPRMRPVINRLADLRKLYGGSAEMYWRGAFPGLAFETNPQLGSDVTIDGAAMEGQMYRYMNSLQRYLVGEGMQIKTLSPTVVDPSTQIDTMITAICIQLGIPKRIFMGSERGVLASGQDSDTWSGRMKDRQQTYLTPRIIIPFVDRLIKIGVLPEPAGFSVVWPELEEESPQEQAQVAQVKTTALAAYVSGGCDVIISPLDYLVRILGFDEDEAQEVLDATKQHLIESRPDAEGEPVPGKEPTVPPKPGEPGSPEHLAALKEHGPAGVAGMGGGPPFGKGGFPPGKGDDDGGAKPSKGPKKPNPFTKNEVMSDEEYQAWVENVALAENSHNHWEQEARDAGGRWAGGGGGTSKSSLRRYRIKAAKEGRTIDRPTGGGSWVPKSQHTTTQFHTPHDFSHIGPGQPVGVNPKTGAPMYHPDNLPEGAHPHKTLKGVYQDSKGKFISVLKPGQTVEGMQPKKYTLKERSGIKVKSVAETHVHRAVDRAVDRAVAKATGKGPLLPKKGERVAAVKQGIHEYISDTIHAVGQGVKEHLTSEVLAGAAAIAAGSFLKMKGMGPVLRTVGKYSGKAAKAASSVSKAAAKAASAVFKAKPKPEQLKLGGKPYKRIGQTVFGGAPPKPPTPRAPKSRFYERYPHKEPSKGLYSKQFVKGGENTKRKLTENALAADMLDFLVNDYMLRPVYNFNPNHDPSTGEFSSGSGGSSGIGGTALKAAKAVGRGLYSTAAGASATAGVLGAERLGGMVGALAGRYVGGTLGAVVGSVVPGAGTAAGAATGLAIGHTLGAVAGATTGGYMAGQYEIAKGREHGYETAAEVGVTAAGVLGLAGFAGATATKIFRKGAAARKAAKAARTGRDFAQAFEGLKEGKRVADLVRHTKTHGADEHFLKIWAKLNPAEREAFKQATGVYK